MEKEEMEGKDFLTAIVDFFEKLAEKYKFTEDEAAEFREILFGGENARNAGPMYDAEAVEMVEETEPEEPEEEEE
jgi:hypothetical protein